MNEGLNELIWESKKTSSEGNYGDSSEGNYGYSPLRNSLSLSGCDKHYRHLPDILALFSVWVHRRASSACPTEGRAWLCEPCNVSGSDLCLFQMIVLKSWCVIFQAALWLPRWLWNDELIWRNCRWKQQFRSLSRRLHWRIAWIHSRLLFEQEIGGCCKAVHGWWYIPKTIKMAHTIFCPTCSSSVWIFHSPARRWTLFPLTFDLGGRSDAGWLLSLGQKRSEREALLEHPLLFACALTESSYHRAQAPQRVHM